jgi:lysophospholipase L1-like esterase
MLVIVKGNKPSLRLKIGVALLSTLAGLFAAEALAGQVRGRAYPYLNIFVADAQMGVRLEGDTRTRVRSRTGRVSEVQTNAAGFRDEPWPDVPDTSDTPDATTNGPIANRALLLGDSQMFGYGVAVEDGVAAQLEVALGPGAEVLNAAIPTWGPTEYTSVIEQLVPRYRPQVVIFVANVANDWFESIVPNRKRTSARDGWATRVSSADGPPPRQFPGRRWLMSRSHLVYVMRSIGAKVGELEGRPHAQAAELLVKQFEQLHKPRAGYRSMVSAHVARARDLCTQWGCEVVVVGLPIDVQVAATEWAKYGSEPRDLSHTEALLSDLGEDARALGLRSINLTQTLRDSSPGAFLDDDYHMSAKGHAAIAQAIAAVILDAQEQRS